MPTINSVLEKLELNIISANERELISGKDSLQIDQYYQHFFGDITLDHLNKLGQKALIESYNYYREICMLFGTFLTTRLSIRFRKGLYDFHEMLKRHCHLELLYDNDQSFRVHYDWIRKGRELKINFEKALYLWIRYLFENDP